MKAVRFHEFGGADVLVYEDVELPVPGDGEVRVRVAATSVNSVDGNIRAGYMQGPIPVVLPHTPGLDVAGTVDALGVGVSRLKVGDNVVGFLGMGADGASAEYVVVPAEILALAPSSIPLSDAAALPVVGLTAWQALFEHAKVVAGQRVLVNGASGAVGDYVVQLAKAAGAHVIATASPRSADKVRTAGADEIIDYTTTDVATSVTEPVDALFNFAPITPEAFQAMVGVVRSGGVVVSTTVWMPAPGDEERGVRAVDMFVRSDAQQLAELVERIDRGTLRVDVAERMPLAELAALHARAAAGTLPGKVVVIATAN
jgi:NADPH:quinone reductase-like Zn-dependent oxidoreductase